MELRSFGEKSTVKSTVMLLMMAATGDSSGTSLRPPDFHVGTDSEWGGSVEMADRGLPLLSKPI